ncbi:Crp/Fnr family transcriptional regulator [Bdellovibrio sp. KM01]|uniref:Crp/Fnr family transcriptional regulator n=1 Tax=Bdellovibrio sp. KM01 TaxID=2748865 RepID=UPI0015EA8E0E|nr:Crp/Fnr family transcriptional regulator [Bdellovibrio sp. KM01]QLY26616.1 Crp/Fnr family transcriptional regulator [Bdellovibrio sp. KM01]
MELIQVFQDARVEKFKRGDVIYKMGENPQNIYFLKEGLVGLVVWGESGKDHLLRLFKKNQIFGHRSFFAQEPYHASATVLDDTTVLVFSKDEMRARMKGNCDLAEKLLQTLATELRRSEEKQVVLTEKDVTARIAESVVYFKDLHPTHSWTRQEIADFCGTTVATVIRTLAKFVEDGLIEQRGREIVILKKEELLSQG